LRFFFVQTDDSKRETQAFLAGLDQMGKPPTSTQLRTVTDAIRAQYARAFAGEGPIQGGKWAALAPSTVRERISKGFPGSHPILQRTGSYRESWVNRNWPAHIEDYQETAGGWQVSVGSQDYRTKWLEKGGARLPARPVRVGMSNQAIGIIAAVKRIYDSRWPNKNQYSK
jgi:hypothetical protein